MYPVAPADHRQEERALGGVGGVPQGFSVPSSHQGFSVSAGRRRPRAAFAAVRASTALRRFLRLRLPPRPILHGLHGPVALPSGFTMYHYVMGEFLARFWASVTVHLFSPTAIST